MSLGGAGKSTMRCLHETERRWSLNSAELFENENHDQAEKGQTNQRAKVEPSTVEYPSTTESHGTPPILLGFTGEGLRVSGPT
jgi:hypothetical protein